VLTFEELLETWDGETAVVHRDRECGAWHSIFEREAVC
jgi:hypothetical protein